MITMTVLLFDRIKYGEGRLGGGLIGAPSSDPPHTPINPLQGAPRGDGPTARGGVSS